MRRFLLVFSLCIALVLCLNLFGCKKAPEVSANNAVLLKFTGSFETTASIRYKDLEAAASLRRTPDSCAMQFTAPPSLQDMAIVFKQDEVELQYRDLSFSFAPSGVPDNAIAQLTFSVIDELLLRDALTLEPAEDVLLVSGRVDSGPFTAALDVRTGALLKLSIPGQEFSITFQDFHFFS